MSSGRDEMMDQWSEESKAKQMEEKLAKVSFAVDDFLAEQANKNELSIGAINGIILARLMRLNAEIGNESDFVRILKYIIEEHESFELERSIQ